MKDWSIVKRSSSNNNLFLKDAKFSLTPEDKEGTTYYGVSNDSGALVWHKNAVDGEIVETSN